MEARTRYQFVGKDRDWGAGQPSNPERYRQRLIKRFWSKVNKSGRTMRPELGSCWEWTASTVNGYGQIGIIPSRLGLNHLRADICPGRAHVIAWVVIYGHPVPGSGLHLCHECDNRPCVREAHLYVGSPADNVHDAQKRGRRPKVDWEQRQQERDAPCRIQREFIDRNLHLITDFRKRQILTLRYGYTYESCRTLGEIGRVFKVTHQRISQIQVEAENTIRALTRETNVPI